MYDGKHEELSQYKQEKLDYWLPPPFVKHYEVSLSEVMLQKMATYATCFVSKACWPREDARLGLLTACDAQSLAKPVETSPKR